MLPDILKKYSIGDFFYPIKSNADGILIKKDFIIEIVQKLKEDKSLLFDQLVDITVTDNLKSDAISSNERFTIIYTFLSLKNNNWYERECYDLFGINFKNHPSLQRIMNDYNFIGHPLRKDFPLTGYEEVRYDDNLKKVIYEPVDLKQEFRDFDNESPWEGMKDIISEELQK